MHMKSIILLYHFANPKLGVFSKWFSLPCGTSKRVILTIVYLMVDNACILILITFDCQHSIEPDGSYCMHAKVNKQLACSQTRRAEFTSVCARGLFEQANIALWVYDV